MIWACPQCYGALSYSEHAVKCVDCFASYPVIAGIPDLRVAAAAWIDFDTDRQRATEVSDGIAAKGVEAAIEDIFINSRGISKAQAQHRMRQIFAGVEKNIAASNEWAGDVVATPSLEIGCGAGQLLVASAVNGQSMAGVDVSLEWLVIAKQMVRSYGGSADLAAGLAEKLPVRTESLNYVVSFDVIEHVSDQTAFVREIGRVLARGGRFAVTTPNRLTLGPEPHVGVWGVGWLPVRAQKHWVKIVSGKKYDHARLLSVFEARAIFQSAGELSPVIEFPPISKNDIELFPPIKARLAKIYNLIIGKKFAQAIAPFFGAYFRITGVRTK